MLLRRMLNERALFTTRRLRPAGLRGSRLLLRLLLLTTMRPPLLLMCFGRSEDLWLLRASKPLFTTLRPTQVLLYSGGSENRWLLRVIMLLPL
jgi:hypothetical protein